MFFHSNHISHSKIRENITPRGDGNYKHLYLILYVRYSSIRENITPRGDGNLHVLDVLTQHKEEIRENITPRGDGNHSSKVV